ncbi:MAG: hypothetical protein HeimC2_28880 [Candidatus Heimdallarchaeota archaeon LC_2]|nr:MAG: hypothetical protein HeimC2_28880 [Candidatus Heimdallarchaeota archaeon LC_2]
MNKISLDQRVLSLFEGGFKRIKASEEQMNRIDTLSKELTDLCDLSREAASQLIFYSIIKWQNETDLNFEDGLIMTYTERLKHKTRMFEIGKDCVAQLISSPLEIAKINKYIDKKMYEYLSQLIDQNESE